MKAAIATLTLLIPTILVGISQRANASEVSTTRLKSTAGTGVASLLMDEATFLNPASISFFQVSSIYLQKADANITPSDDSPLAASEQDELVFVASDAKGPVDGSISYTKAKDQNGKYSRLAASMSSPIGKKSALGFSYAYLNHESGPRKGKSKVITAGVTHALTPEFTLGLVVPDLLGEDLYQRRAIIGAQYVYKDFVALMLDAGTDWQRETSESSLIRAAIQLKVFEDFYMRFGAQEDRGLRRKGTGAGIGWVQPKLVIDVALTRTENAEFAEIDQHAEIEKETSFSLSYRF